VAVAWDRELPVRRFYAEDPWGNRIEFAEGEKKKERG